MTDFVFLLILACFVVILLLFVGDDYGVVSMRKIERPENKVRFYLQELKAKGIEFVASEDPGEITAELSQQAEEYVSKNKKKYKKWYDRNKSK